MERIRDRVKLVGGDLSNTGSGFFLLRGLLVGAIEAGGDFYFTH